MSIHILVLYLHDLGPVFLSGRAQASAEPAELSLGRHVTGKRI